MYIWVILATFVVALFSYNLSVRSDSRDLYVTPQAQAVVSKLLIQHEAVTKYTKKQYTLAKKGQDGTMYLGTVTKEELNPKENPDTGKPEGGILSETVLQGFRPEVGEVSKLYCIKSRDMNEAETFKNLGLSPDGARPDIKLCYGAEDESGTITEKDNGDGTTTFIQNKNYARLYVVTTMPIPVRWRARTEDDKGILRPIGAPNEDLIKAIKKTSTQGVKMGYVVPAGKYKDQVIDEKIYKDSAGNSLRVSNFEYFISGFQDKLVPIPKAISQNGLLGSDANECHTKDTDGNTNCLIVMSVVR